MPMPDFISTLTGVVMQQPGPTYIQAFALATTKGRYLQKGPKFQGR